jgi:hypothetical protein
MKKMLFCFSAIIIIAANAFGQTKIVVGAVAMSPIQSKTLQGYGMISEIISAAF